MTEEGCIASVRLLRGHPALSLEAMTTVSQWEFEPATLNGEPVDIYFSLTVNFRLK